MRVVLTLLVFAIGFGVFGLFVWAERRRDDGYRRVFSQMREARRFRGGGLQA